jgi:divalent metal cation (Fe/Co/Zn/Cd) transporter
MKKEDAELMSFMEAHDLEENIQEQIENLEFVKTATIHLDYHNDSIINRIVK